MKQLFFVLVLIAIASTGYLKAIQSQDDAARELAQIIREEKKPEDLSQSFEKVAAEVEKQVALTTITTSIPVQTFAPATGHVPPHAVDASGEQNPELKEAESQIAELRLETIEEPLFAGKAPAAKYEAIRKLYLMSKFRGAVREESALEAQCEELLAQDLVETRRVYQELVSSAAANSELGEIQSWIERKLDAMPTEPPEGAHP